MSATSPFPWCRFLRRRFPAHAVGWVYAQVPLWRLRALPATLLVPMGFSPDSENEKGTTGRRFDGVSQRAPKLWLPPQL